MLYIPYYRHVIEKNNSIVSLQVNIRIYLNKLFLETKLKNIMQIIFIVFCTRKIIITTVTMVYISRN